jgi:hypothetical protein
MCIQSCSSGYECGPYHECSNNVCSLDVGTDCEANKLCGAGTCTDTDAQGNAVSSYGTIFCDTIGGGSGGYGGAPPSPCPDGYTCASNECRRW